MLKMNASTTANAKKEIQYKMVRIADKDHKI